MPRGGHRPGAGRTPLPEDVKRHKITIRLKPEAIEWLRSQPVSQGQAIEQLIEEARHKE